MGTALGPLKTYSKWIFLKASALPSVWPPGPPQQVFHMTLVTSLSPAPQWPPCTHCPSDPRQPPGSAHLRTLSLPSVASLSVPTSKLLCIKPCHFLASGLSRDVCFWFNSHLSPAVTCLHLPPGLRTLLICYFLSRFPVYPSLLASSCNLLTSCPCS